MVKILLKEVRKRENISTRALSEISGISRSHIIEIEGGRAIPSIETLCRLANALGVSAEELYFCEKNEVIKNNKKTS